MNDTALTNDRAATTRRNVLSGLAGGIAAVSTGVLATAHAQEPASTPLPLPAFDADHRPRPLPFDAAKLTGLSVKLIESHWSNNYAGSVRALNETQRRLRAALADRSMPAFIYNDLKREHLMRTGSVVLHELYFANLGGNGRAPSDVRRTIGQAFGTFDRWETEYRRIAAGLGGGSGWVVLGYNRQFGALENYWMADHLHGAANTVPLLVMDMYEHSYHMDFGAATGRYIDAFFQNINWEAASQRLAAVV